MAIYIMKPWYGKAASGTTMTVILDLTNPDPTQWATYADDAVGMTAGSDAWDDFFGHYPCILENGVELGKLKRDNFAQYEDGTTAPITTIGKDVMIAFPKRGIKLEYLDANTLSVSMTKEANKTGYSYWAHSYSNSSASLTNAVCDKFYLGAYEGYVTTNMLYSSSGKTPTVSQTMSTFRTYAQSRGTGYEQSGFFQLTYRQVMYLLKYKGQNAQTAIGRGFVDSTNSDLYGAVGSTNTSGMDWGESTGKYPMKLFGLENFYGDLYEFLEGVRPNSSRQLYVADGNFNDAGTNYVSAGTTAYNADVSTILRYPNGTNLAGFTPANNTSANDYSEYFCDNTFISADLLAYNSGNWNASDAAGVFILYMNKPTTSAKENTGARLMYMHVA